MMKRMGFNLRFILGGLAGLLTTVNASAGAMPSQAQILSDMTLANKYFTNEWPNPGCTTCLTGGRPTTIWTRATYFEGSLAMWRVNHDPAITNYATQWGNFHGWKLRNGAVDTSADNQCAGSEYIELYQLNTTQTNRITNIVANLNYWMFTNKTKVDFWWYIDGIHMSMPAFAKMAAISGSANTNYSYKMYIYWHYVKDTVGPSNGLYNVTDHLWVRDTNFLANYTAQDGTKQKCYWSRGNGWVFAGLARTLDVLPASDAHFAEYLQTFREMAAALTAVQRADGFWNVNLGYANDYPGPESSGTAMFTYGLAWGIHHGYLAQETYLPAVINGWNALTTTALHHGAGSDAGFIGYVQSSGSKPSDSQPVTYNSTPDFDDYTLGALLLAGSEVCQLTNLSQTITFNSLTNRTYGDTPITLSASASSGLPVSFSCVSGPATLTSNLLSITGAGTVCVRASQGGNSTYAAATNVDQSFTVASVPLTLVAKPAGKVYGDTDPVLTYQLTGSLIGNDSLNGSLIREPGENAGSYRIQQGTLAAGTNYALNFVEASFTITPAQSINTLASSKIPAQHGESVNLTATIAPVLPATATPTGTVQFFVNDLPQGSPVPLSSGIAVLSANNLPDGTNILKAVYGGNGNFLASTGSLTQVVLSPILVPQTLGISGNNDSTVVMRFQGTPGAQYWVQAADNLNPANWQTISTNTAGLDGIWLITNSKAASFKRYFRSAKP